jgi:hypothetical protein
MFWVSDGTRQHHVEKERGTGLLARTSCGALLKSSDWRWSRDPFSGVPICRRPKCLSRIEGGDDF